MRQAWKLPWRWKSWEFIILPFRLFFMYPPTKKNNDQYPTMLFPTAFVKHSKILNFSIKSDFTYLIFSRFFLDNQDY